MLGARLLLKLIITDIVEPHGIPKKRRKLILSREEKSAIVANEMLSDESINIAMNMLHQQFPAFDGLVDSSIGKLHAFPIVVSDKPYIQILHAGEMHWVCVGNTKNGKKDNAAHYLYDSFANGICNDVIDQIAGFSFCRQSELIVNTMPVQQ